MSCPQCFSGHINPGKPLGKFETIFGRSTYVAHPPGGKEPLGIIVIVPDAFGVPFINNQILADHYASRGQYLVYLPDFMDGQHAPVRTMINMAHMSTASYLSYPYYILAVMVDFVPFLIRNRFGVAWPRVTAFLKQLRNGQGKDLPVGIAGFCWGGLHAITLTHDRPDCKTDDGRQLADAFFAAHPSSVTLPGDAQAVKMPLSVAIGDEDFVMGIKQVREMQDILKSKTTVDTEVVIYPGAGHGFAVRASKAEPDSKETKQSDEAEEQAISWFKKQFDVVKQKKRAP